MWSEILLLAAARISCGSVSTKAGEHRRFSCLPRIVSVFSNLVQDHIWLNHERVWRGHRLKCSSLPEQSENLLFALYLVGYLNRSLEPKVYFMELLMAVTVFAVTYLSSARCHHLHLSCGYLTLLICVSRHVSMFDF